MKYPIGCWTYIPLNKIWDTFVKDHHDLGITVLMSPMFHHGDDPAAMIKILDECHACGMKVMLHDERVVAHQKEARIDEAVYRARFARSLEEFGWHPAVMGY